MAEKGTTVARAYVQITPSLQGAGKEIEKELDKEAKPAGESTGRKLGTHIGNGLKNAGKVIGAALGTAFAAAGAGIVALSKQAIGNFSEFEQLAGGVEKIFDEMDTSTIMADASNAYKNLNMSANQYLNAVNSVGAAFSATMGDQQAYETAKKGMQAIADFASGTGKNVDELNQKYQMITRSTSSYQSIADQFSGILPATSADFLKQAQAAGLLSDKYKSLTEVPIAEYQQAVTDMLAKGTDQLGLTGNTAKEAMSTISGSVAATQGAWSNFLTALGGGGDISKATTDLVNSALAVGQNILPVIQTVLSNVSAAIPQILSMLVAALPDLMGVVTGVIQSVAASLSNPETIAMIVASLKLLADCLLQNLPILINAATQIITSMAQSLTEGDNVGKLIDGAFQIINCVNDGIVAALPVLIPAVVKMIAQISDHMSKPENLGVLVTTAIKLVDAIVKGLLKSIPSILKTFTDAFSNLKNIFVALVEWVANGLEGWASSEIMAKVKGFVSLFISNLKAIVDKAKSIGKDLITGLWNGINDKVSWLTDKIKSFTNGVTDKLKKFFKIGSPSKVMADEVGRWLGEGIGVGFVGSMDGVADDMEASMNFATQLAVSGAAVGDLGTVGETNNFGSTVINVYGAQGQDVNALANIIMEKIQTATERRAAVYA